MDGSQGIDAFEAVAAAIRRNKFIPVPPEDRNFVTPDYKDFIGQGIQQLRALVRHGLRPEHNLLDVGCGIGRLALPATQYLDGRYFGIDSNLSGIAWCHENIATRYQRFQFAVINAKNPHYGHRAEYGQEPGTQAAWPTPPNLQFDWACAFSLFTHLNWEDTQHYFGEIAKRLKPGGRVLTTWFMIDEEAAANARSDKALVDFDMALPGPMRTALGNTRYKRAIGYDYDAIRDLAAHTGFRIAAFERGGWHDRTGGQDRLVMEARA